MPHLQAAMEEAYLRQREEAERDFQDGWHDELVILGRAIDLGRLNVHEIEELKPLLRLLKIPH